MAQRNECRVDTAVTVDGRLFHALTAATRNSRSPSHDLLVGGTMSAGELDDKLWPYIFFRDIQRQKIA